MKKKQIQQYHLYCRYSILTLVRAVWNADFVAAHERRLSMAEIKRAACLAAPLRLNSRAMALAVRQGFNASADRVRAILESERAKGMESSRMVVGGFSQGGAVALHVCLRSAEPLAGTVLLLCYFFCLAFVVDLSATEYTKRVYVSAELLYWTALVCL